MNGEVRYVKCESLDSSCCIHSFATSVPKRSNDVSMCVSAATPCRSKGSSPCATDDLPREEMEGKKRTTWEVMEKRGRSNRIRDTAFCVRSCSAIDRNSIAAARGLDVMPISESSACIHARIVISLLHDATLQKLHCTSRIITRKL